MDVNTIYQVSHLDPWEGSMGTGAGYLEVPRKKKKSEDEDPESKKKKDTGITQDSSGVVHVDLMA